MKISDKRMAAFQSEPRMPNLPGWQWELLVLRLSMTINRAPQALAESAGWARNNLSQFNCLWRSLIEGFMAAQGQSWP